MSNLVRPTRALMKLDEGKTTNINFELRSRISQKGVSVLHDVLVEANCPPLWIPIKHVIRT